MRLLLGALILLALFLAATTWQRHWTSAARAEREAVRHATRNGTPATGDAADAENRARVLRELASEPEPEGWSRVVVGRPSGSERFGAAEHAPVPPTTAPGAPLVPGAPGATTGPTADGGKDLRPAPGSSTAAPAPPASAPKAAVADSSWIVQPGQSLSRICTSKYGTARAEVVEAVARHNGLASADQVREGQKLDLPPLEQLLPKR